MVRVLIAQIDLQLTKKDSSAFDSSEALAREVNNVTMHIFWVLMANPFPVWLVLLAGYTSGARQRNAS